MRDLDALERHLLSVADDDLPARTVAHSATVALATVVDGAEIESPGDSPSASYYMRSAVLLLSIIALRTARACLLVISAGYEPEAHGLKRRLSEVHARAQAVLADTTGQHAREWLDGKGPSTPQRIVGKWGAADTFDMYSESAHASVTGVRWWLMVPMSDDNPDDRGLLVHAHRRPKLSNAMLTEVAMECRDMAHVQAACQGGALSGLEQLDRYIEQAIETYMDSPPEDDTPASP